MRETARACYLAGTKSPQQRNADALQLPLDVQAWSVLSFSTRSPSHPESLQCAEKNHRTTADGVSGYDFNDDRDGVWFEGLAHMATAYAVTGNDSQASALRQVLAQAQNIPAFGSGGGVSAASHDGVSSGFGFDLYRRLHVGATAWNIFAQQIVNPYYIGSPANSNLAPSALGQRPTPRRFHPPMP